MELNIGTNLKRLRTAKGITQEQLSEAMNVSCAAVSKWERGESYPDITLLQPLAFYFGITIDELFGFESNRDKKIDAIIQKIDSFSYRERSDDDWVDDCLSILREGLAEFPQNERLLMLLADTLSEAGWRRHTEWLYYDDEGFIQHKYDVNKKNEYWNEAIKICEYLVENAKDNSNVTKALSILVLLYRNNGENERAVSCANKMPELKFCKEIMLACGTDGKDEAKYIGYFLVETVKKISQQLVYALITNRHNFETDMPIKKIKGVIGLFDLIFDDGNMGECHMDLICLYLYLSRIQWERGYHDDAFVSLYEALKHAKAFDALNDGQEHTLSAPLVSFVDFKIETNEKAAHSLPDNWPIWCNPDYSEVEKEIKADPRWNEWVKRTQE